MADKSEFIILPPEAKIGALGHKSETNQVVVYIENGKSRFVSDGYHTFDELYMFRLLYNAALFNMLAKADIEHPDPLAAHPHNAHKSLKHADGEDCFGGGWFIVVAYLNGQQVTNHYKLQYWDLFKIEARQRADEWDGHTPQDVIERLTDFVKETPDYEVKE